MTKWRNLLQPIPMLPWLHVTEKLVAGMILRSGSEVLPDITKQIFMYTRTSKESIYENGS
jgi:hypothetical protein